MGWVKILPTSPLRAPQPLNLHRRTIRKNETKCGFFTIFCKLLVCVSGPAAEGYRGRASKICTRPLPPVFPMDLQILITRVVRIEEET